MSVKSAVTGRINKAIRPLGVQLVRRWSDDAAIQSFLPARKTLAAARRAGLSISDYVDQYSAEPGTTDSTVAAMLRLAEMSGHVDRVCEIGPGTGRYAERVIAALEPSVYEVYETAADWLPHLRRLRGVKILPADGRSLSGTAAGSIDLVHAQKVFVYLPLMTTVGYLEEMARVVRPGGVVAFDILTENCIDETVISSWVSQNVTLYSMIPRQWTIDLLAGHDLYLVGNAFAALSGGRTELLVFRRK